MAVFDTGQQLQTVTNVLQNVVVALGNLTSTIKSSTGAIFPQTQGTSTTASVGIETLPGNTAGFITVQLPVGSLVNGVAITAPQTVKVPFYLT